MSIERDYRLTPIDNASIKKRGALSEVSVASLSIMSDNGLREYQQSLECSLDYRSGLVLDIGTGRNARFVREAGKKGIRAVGVAPFLTQDGPPIISNETKAKKRPKLAQACASALPFPDETFDMCVSLYAVSYICPYLPANQATGVYEELIRVLKRGGRACLGRYTPKELELALPFIHTLHDQGVSCHTYQSNKWVDRHTYAKRYTVHLTKPQ